MRFLISFGMTKKECHCEQTKVAWQSHFDYNRKAVIANERSECGNPINDYNPKKSSRACLWQAWWSHIDYLDVVLMFFKTNTMRENMRFLTMFGMTPSE